MIKSENIRNHLERWLTPDGKLLTGQLHGTPSLRSDVVDVPVISASPLPNHADLVVRAEALTFLLAN